MRYIRASVQVVILYRYRAMDEKELLHRLERSQQELEYWRNKADQMRSVLDHLETDYLRHRTDCFLVRRRHLREAVGRALDAVAALEGGGGGGGRLPNPGAASSTSSGRSSPTETSSLLTTPQPSSNVSTSDYSRNVRRLALRSQLQSTINYTFIAFICFIFLCIHCVRYR